MADPFQTDEWNDQSITTLVTKAREGCGSSQEQLFGQLQTYLAYVAKEQLDKKLQAKLGPSDIVQQSFVKAVEALNEFRGNTAAEFKGWLKRIAVNEAKQIQRSYNADKRQVTKEQRAGPDSEAAGPGLQLIDGMLTPQAGALAAEEADAVKAALDRLPEKYRRVIELRNWQGMQFNEIAEQIGSTVSATSKLWYRGLVMLQEEFDRKH